MREQVITHKVGNRSGLARQRPSGAVTQRPTRRDRESGGETFASRLRALLAYVPAFLKLALAIVAGLVIFAGYRAAASASFFQVRKVEIAGASRVSAEEVQAIVRREANKTGVWKADLADISARLERLPWVRTAVVSRVLPDGMRVRISERVSRAVVRTSSGRFRWVDDDAVLLGEMLPTDQLPTFFLRGWNEEESEAARMENSERVQKFLELQRDWDAAGLSERVSEVNLIDIRDVRAQLAGDDSQIEVRLGSQDLGKRLKQALEVLDEQRQSPRGPLVSYIDLSQGKRAIVGLVSGAHATSDGFLLSASAMNAGVKTERETVAKPAREKTVAANKNALESKAKKERDTKDRKTEKKSDKQKRNSPLRDDG